MTRAILYMYIPYDSRTQNPTVEIHALYIGELIQVFIRTMFK